MPARIPADIVADATSHGLTIQRTEGGLVFLTPGGCPIDKPCANSAAARRFLGACKLNPQTVRDVAARIDREAEEAAGKAAEPVASTLPPVHSDASRFTVWQFRSTDGTTKTVARYAEPDDMQVQHEYQTVLWQGPALSREDALRRAGINPASARVRFAPVSRQSGGYDIIDRDNSAIHVDGNGARHWFGDLHFAEKACAALNAGKPCPSMSEMCEAPAAGSRFELAPDAHPSFPVRTGVIEATGVPQLRGDAETVRVRFDGEPGARFVRPDAIVPAASVAAVPARPTHVDIIPTMEGFILRAHGELARDATGRTLRFEDAQDAEAYFGQMPPQFVVARTMRGEVVRRHGPFAPGSAELASTLEHERLAADMHNRGRDFADKREVVCVSGNGPAAPAPTAAEPDPFAELAPGEVAGWLKTKPHTPVAILEERRSPYPASRVRFLAAGHGHAVGDVAWYGTGSSVIRAEMVSQPVQQQQAQDTRGAAQDAPTKFSPADHGLLPYLPCSSEDQVERAVCRYTDKIDALFMAGKLEQAEYDQCIRALDKWAEYQYAQFANL